MRAYVCKEEDMNPREAHGEGRVLEGVGDAEGWIRLKYNLLGPGMVVHAFNPST